MTLRVIFSQVWSFLSLNIEINVLEINVRDGIGSCFLGGGIWDVIGSRLWNGSG
ncbi:MAG TPA: hypothetical protein V6C57_20315 [Coleofasciculaceae cyanobacterium]